MNVSVRKENKQHTQRINTLKNVDPNKLRVVKEDKNKYSDSDNSLISSEESASDISDDESFRKPSDKSYTELSNPIKTKAVDDIAEDNDSVYRDSDDNSDNNSDNNSVASGSVSSRSIVSNNSIESRGYNRHSSGHSKHSKNRHEKKYETEEEKQRALDEKAEILSKFERLAAKGIKTEKRYNMKSRLEDMKKELKRISRSIEVDNSIKFQRRTLIAILSGLEFVNKRYDPFDLKLDGWSESVMDGIDDYDNVFERLYDKYSGTADVAPEIELMMMLAGSAFMFHMTKSLFKNNIPNMGDIIKENPNLMQSIANSMKSNVNTNSVNLPPSVPTFNNTRPNAIQEDMQERMSETSFVTDMSEVKNVTVHTTPQTNKKKQKTVMNLTMD